MFERLRRAWQAARLEYDIAHGKRTWGRQPADPVNDQSDGSGRVGVRVPVKATIEAVVIRADGTREDRGVLSTGDAEIDAAVLEHMRRTAKRGKP